MGPAPGPHRGNGDAAGRFVLLGAANTALTFGLFTALQYVTAVAVAYSIAFALGIAFSTAFTARLVFGAQTTPIRRAAFAGCYLVIYGVGLVVSHLLAGHQPAWAVSGWTIAVTAPLGFLCARTVLAPRQRETRRSP